MSESIQNTQQKTKDLVGRVAVGGDKRAKTRKVLVEWTKPHPKYQKVMRGTTVYHVHDENEASKEGDIVTIRQCAPVSKSKTYTLVSIMSDKK